MNAKDTACVGFLLHVLIATPLQFSTVAGATFTNLDFESASLPFVPRGQSGGLVSIQDALPAWNGYLGDRAQMQVLHNDTTLGNASISAWGPDAETSRIEGNFSVLLFPGVDPSNPSQLVNVSLTQTGWVPSDAQFILFKARTPSFPFGSDRFAVFLGSQQIPVHPLSMDPGFTLYAGNISAFAGIETELRFTAFVGGNVNDLYLDAITFSAVPEPGTWGLLALAGALLLGFRLCRAKNR